MTDRRRHPRFELRTPLECRLRLTREVLVERYDLHDLVVLSAVPALEHESLQLNEVMLRPPLACDLRVVESTPAISEGLLRHRLRLRRCATALKADIMATLAREVPTRLREICRGGCLLEIDVALESESVAEIVLQTAGHLSSGLVQIRRVVPIVGRSPGYYAGAEFVSRGTHGLSLPLAVDRLVTEEEWTDADGHGRIAGPKG